MCCLTKHTRFARFINSLWAVNHNSKESGLLPQERPRCHMFPIKQFTICILYSKWHSSFEKVYSCQHYKSGKHLLDILCFMLSLYYIDLWQFLFLSSFSLPHSRHSGGGCDLHRQGAAQCHEHLQPKAQGTVVWTRAWKKTTFDHLLCM